MTVSVPTVEIPAVAPRRVRQGRGGIGRASVMLIASNFVTSAIGLVYWLVAARQLDQAQLGLDAAVVNTVILASNLGSLDLVHAIPRYLPAAGHRARAFVTASYGVALACSLAVAAVLLLGVQTFTPTLGFLVDQWQWTALFLLAVAAWSTFALQDCVLIALRRNAWVPIENVVFAVAKLVLLVVLVDVLPEYAVLLSWALPALAFVLIVNLGVVRPAVRPTLPPLPVTLPPRRRLARTVLVGNGANVVAIVVGGSLPLIVTERFGAAANASYYLAWSMAYVLFLAPRYVSLVVLSSAEHAPERLDGVTVRATLTSSALVGAAALVALVLARPVLGLVGEAYEHDAVALLRLMCLAAVPHCVVVMAAAWARARQRVGAAVVVTAVEYAMVALFAVVLVAPVGLVGLGWAWLLGDSIVAVGAGVWVWRAARRAAAEREVAARK